MPYFTWDGSVFTSCPPQFPGVRVRGRDGHKNWMTFTSEITHVIDDWLDMRRLLYLGWIRCNQGKQNQNFYRPRFFRPDGQVECIQRKYGPRFREVLNEGEQPPGELAQYYNFSQDPVYQK